MLVRRVRYRFGQRAGVPVLRGGRWRLQGGGEEDLVDAGGSETSDVGIGLDAAAGEQAAGEAGSAEGLATLQHRDLVGADGSQVKQDDVASGVDGVLLPPRQVVAEKLIAAKIETDRCGTGLVELFELAELVGGVTLRCNDRFDVGGRVRRVDR